MDQIIKDVRLRRTGHGLYIHASNCGVAKTLIMKNGDVVILGDSAVLSGFKKFQIEARVKD